MFSIAAINETDSAGKWEPLAPTKEAQEFHLSQTYHEGLLKLQEKDYGKARELLESVLKDPLMSNAQVGNVPNDRHLLQLRFLSLKNLATVFLQQGPMHYESALRCYFQAAELDENDSVVWNHLGTLSCKMGLLSTSRWAFEQGLLCSPHNWNCMEKLLEVLIAIGDEVACLSIANLILRHWPSHSRALHVKQTIEDVEGINSQPLAARGIDRLEPKHVRLKFPEKRKSVDDEVSNSNTCKRHKPTIELQLGGATWSALLDAIDGNFLQPAATNDSEPEVLHGDDNARNGKLVNRPAKELSGYASIDKSILGIQRDEKLDIFTCTRIDICLPEFPKTPVNPAKGKEQGMHSIEGCELVGSYGVEKTTPVKEKDISTDREHPQERRSTRLERLRSRKLGKEESETSAKDQANIVFQILEPFLLRRLRNEDQPCPVTPESIYPNPVTYNSDLEHDDIVQFISKTSKNCGALHIIHMLLEDVAHKHIPFHDSFVKFLELEKLTRNWGQDRSPLCSLFLAELYYDQGSWFANRSKQLEYMSDASYHLCKVIELVTFDCTDELIGLENHFGNIQTSMEMDDSKGTSSLVDDRVEKESIPSLNDPQTVVEMTTSCSISKEKNEHCSTLTDNDSFWVRYFWLSGRLSLYQDCKAKALNEFCICLTLLRNNKNLEEASDFIFLPHCKLMRLITVDRILHEINLLKLDSLVGRTSDELMEKGMHLECMNMLSPLLLSTKEVYLDSMYGPLEEKERIMSVELSALDLLVSACEKAEPVDIQVYLNCYRRKLQVLIVAAGMEGSPGLLKGKNLVLKSCSVYDKDFAESLNRQWKILVSEEVKDISRIASRVKNFIDQDGAGDSFNSVVSIVADIQSLLLAVMCSAMRTIISQKLSGSITSGQTDQLDSWCLVDAAIAFCKLQHLDSSVSIKTQVDLIVAVHDLLAEYGLCCAGRDSAGEEGPFLKFAIKHLLSLDVKLKQLSGTNGQEEATSLHKNTEEIMVSDCNSTYEEGQKQEDSLDTGKKSKLDSSSEQEEGATVGDVCSSLPDDDIEEVELSIDTALDQSFFCLYGFKIDSSGEEELSMHKNTSRGEYQTKEQCADVFQYVLPYAKALSRAGLVKLRRVLRAIRKHFPQPPDELLLENPIEKFLDGPDLWEDKLCEVAGLDGSRELITNILSSSRGLETIKKTSFASSEQYLDVYGNLYYFIAQAEEISAIDKYAGFVLKKEGEEFVEQSANLFKYDLLYNPMRFESWQKLANIYDEEVDLLLNDGSKHISILDWRKNTNLHQRVENGRRRSRRCLLMGLALASTPSQQSQMHELLALVYYDSLQNVVPFYDQRSILPTKDSTWITFCQNSMRHFEKAFELKSEWLHAFYLGKLCQKMGQSPAKALSYFNKAASLNPSAVDPVYRMHASRLKLLYTRGKQNLDVLQVVAAHAFSQSTRETILDMFNWTNEDLMQMNLDVNEVPCQDDLMDKRNIDPKLLEKAWHILYDDCLLALGICVEGELKHFHKARYMLAKGLYRRGEAGDVERSKEELSFCFKSSRSSFTVNMWEIDGMARKGRRRNPGLAGNKKNLELSLSESSRKFITCVRKYMLFYLNLLEKTRDLWTLERAYVYLKTDKRFVLCLGDIIPVALGKYIQVLISSIRDAEIHNATNNSASLEQMLEKLLNIFMDHVNMWTEIISLPELKSPDLSESILYSYIHQYIHLLESDIRLDALEGINEKIRKRFKNPKLTNNNLAKVCKHASLAWCRSIIIKLALITPLPESGESNDKPASLENSLLLFVDLQPDELLVSPLEGTFQSKGLDMNWFEALYKIKNVQIRKASEENMEAAAALMKCTYNFYRESSCATFPSGINLYTGICISQSAVEGLQQQGKEKIDALDLSIPRKLLLWAYTLVHGRYSNISAVVKYCEEGKPQLLVKKRWTAMSTVKLRLTRLFLRVLQLCMQKKLLIPPPSLSSVNLKNLLLHLHNFNAATHPNLLKTPRDEKVTREGLIKQRRDLGHLLYSKWIQSQKALSSITSRGQAPNINYPQPYFHIIVSPLRYLVHRHRQGPNDLRVVRIRNKPFCPSLSTTSASSSSSSSSSHHLTSSPARPLHLGSQQERLASFTEESSAFINPRATRLGRCCNMSCPSSSFASTSSFLPRPRFPPPLHAKIDSLAVVDPLCSRMFSCRSAKIESLEVFSQLRTRIFATTSVNIESLKVFDLPKTIICNSRRKRRKKGIHLKAGEDDDSDAFVTGPSSMNLEAEIYEFMRKSDKPMNFPTKKELIAAGRTDLVEAVAAQGGWLTFGWDVDSDIVSDGSESKNEVVLEGWRAYQERVYSGSLVSDPESVPSRSGVTQENGRTSEESVSNGSLLNDPVSVLGSDDRPSAPSSSGRSLDTDTVNDGGIDGILSRLEKERNLTFCMGSRGEVVNGRDSWGNPVDDPGDIILVDRKLDMDSNERNSKPELSESKTGFLQDCGDRLLQNGKLKDINGIKSSMPDMWRSWSLQRAGFSMTDFEAAEIVPIEDRKILENGPLNVEHRCSRILQQAQNTDKSHDELTELAADKSQIHIRLQDLEAEINHHLLKSRVNGAVLQKHKENSIEELHRLSDAWEFQETEIMKARDKLRSIRAKLAVLEGKLSLEIMYVFKLLS
ncbi:hypothetical protein Cni_G24025 [Canna indica]|uniref:Calcineurin-binding protein 1 n=1 Tax=Canna indica TaxID=4628 RepID=A0AAQ3KV44_9LILI|nr:hypothetical protein Cni_G24025 [Canna indica]